MPVTFDQAIALVSALPPTELRKLYLWMQQRDAIPQKQPEISNHKALRLQWLKANQARYGGQFVVLDGDKLLGVAKTYPEGRALAEAAGVPDAYVDYLSRPDEEGFMG